jgi:hypothetical protein
MSRAKVYRLRNHGPARFMVEAEGWVMARRPGCIPFLIARDEWEALPLCDRSGKIEEPKP